MEIRFGFNPYQRQKAHKELKKLGYNYTVSFIHDEKWTFKNTFMYCTKCKKWKCRDKDTYREYCCPGGCESSWDICIKCGISATWSYDINDKIYRHPNAVVGSNDWMTIQILTRKTMDDYINATKRADKRQAKSKTKHNE